MLKKLSTTEQSWLLSILVLTPALTMLLKATTGPHAAQSAWSILAFGLFMYGWVWVGMYVVVVHRAGRYMSKPKAVGYADAERPAHDAHLARIFPWALRVLLVLIVLQVLAFVLVRHAQPLSTLVVQLVVYLCAYFAVLYFDRKGRARLQPYLDSFDGRVCPVCFYPTASDHNLDDHQRCTECGGSYPDDQLITEWNARKRISMRPRAARA